MEILRAWTDWKKAVGTEGERSGIAAANVAYRVVADKFEGIAGALAKTPAATIEGVLAKTRAFLTMQWRTTSVTNCASSDPTKMSLRSALHAI